MHHPATSHHIDTTDATCTHDGGMFFGSVPSMWQPSMTKGAQGARHVVSHAPLVYFFY